jgi:hypothetical protein
MNEKSKGIISLVIALAALLISTLWYSQPQWGLMPEKIWLGLCLWLFGGIPGLALSLISFLVSLRLKNRPLKIVIWLILAVSAISALVWALLGICFVINPSPIVPP